MKVETKVGNVFMSEGLEVVKARIKINRQSFKILYGDLYSDKIRAVIRELSTNAHDSHVFAGKSDVPFEIHLPNELEPFFYVRDFGTGLSPEQVCGEKDGIYITFCDSNKIHSNDATGCLGLGSKSPLTYTDNFAVESNYNGVKYSYAMFLDEEGQPCIAPMGQCDTTEPNGLKVEFGVKEKDFEEFNGKVAEVLSWFKVRPNVVGNPDFKFEEREYLRKTDRYGIHKERQHESRVVMGNVAYPIRAGDFAYNGKLDDIEQAMVEYGVDLFVEIGEVEFVPSREKLSYTDKTIATVRNHLADAIKSIREELETQVLAQPSVWAARRMLHDIKHSILGKVRSLGTVMYHDKEIAEYVNFHSMVQRTMPGMDKANPAYPKLEMISKRKEHYRRHDEDTLHCDNKKIYFNDLAHGGYARIHKDIRDNYGRSAYMLTGVSQEFLDYSGIGEVAIKASSLAPIERAKREVVNGDGTRSYVKRTVLQEYVPTGGNYMADWWTDVEVDPRAGGIYVVVAYGQIVDGEVKTLPSDIKRRYNAVKALRPDFKLYGIRPNAIGRIEKYKSRWMKFDDFAELVLKTEFPQAVDKIQLIRQYENLENNEMHERFLTEVFEEYSTFGKFLDKLREAKAATADVKVKAVLRLNEAVKNSFSLDGEASELNQLAEKLDETYPLIQYIDPWHRRGGEFVQHFAEYIRGIDDRSFKASLQPVKEVG